jgi:methyl-accepting chemotaxis protein
VRAIKINLTGLIALTFMKVYRTRKETSMSMKKQLILSYFTIITGVIFLGILSILMNQNSQVLIEKQEQRYQSYLLADQLRQSSDELTRMAKTYVVTGNSQYEKMYWDILAIRNGEKPRPQHYERIYWDLVLEYADKPRPDGETISLQTLMRKAGFTQEEFAKLREAQNNSDGLVKTETIAMNAMKGLYDDGSGNYVKKGEPDFEMARRIMYDTQYHNDKASIMKPIDDFFGLLDERTKTQVEHHVKTADLFLFIIQVVVLLLAALSIVLGIFMTKTILKQVGGEPAEIAKITEQVARGNLDVQFDSNSTTATGIYAAVQIMVNHLKTVIEDIVQVSQGLVNGNLHVTPQAKYEGNFVEIKNALEMGLSNLRLVIEDIVQISQKLAEGQQCIEAKAEYRGNFLPIKDSLETLSVNLMETTAQNKAIDWLKTGQTQLNKQMSGEQDMVHLAGNIITFLTTYLEAQVGVFYLLEEREKGKGAKQKGDILKLLASYAYTQRKGMANEFQIGEGLVGQAALENQRIIVTEIPEDYMSIQSGIGEAVPHQLIVMPFLYENTVKGIIEIGSFHEITAVQLEWLEQVMPNIGIAVNTTESRTKMQALLQK